MQEFIQQAVSQLGMSEDSAQSATGGVLNLLKDKLDGDTFSEVLEAVPGAENLLQGQGSGGGGLLSGALSGLGSSLGGSLGSAAGLLSALQSSGLDASQLGPFANLLTNFLKSKLDAGLMERVLRARPIWARCCREMKTTKESKR